MYNKTGHVNLETSANLHNRLDTNLAFFSTDLGTADLVFNITRNNLPLMVSEENASTLLILMKGDEYIVQEVEYVDPMNGQLKVTVDDKVLARPGKWRGQIYIEVHDVNNPSKEDIVTQAEFTFDIKDSVINTIPAIDKLNEIRTFIEFREAIMEQISVINDGLANGNDYVSQMEATKASGMKALNDRTTQVLKEITTLVGTSTQEITDLKENTITELDDKATQIKADVEKLNKYDTTNWQKYKLTKDDGYTLYDSNFKLDFNNVEQLTNLGVGTRYIAGPINAPIGASSNNGWLTKLDRGSIKYLEFRPYNSSQIFIKRFYNTWSDWELMTPETPELNKRQPLGTLGEEGNKYTSVLQLPPGFYECVIPSDAFYVNAPQEPNGKSYYAEIDVYEGNSGRKQFRLIMSHLNNEYHATIHTDGVDSNAFKGWKKVQNEEEYNALFDDTGWIDWETKGNATKRNTTDDTQIKCQYRIRKVNGTRIAHLRVNVNNLTTQVAFGSIPAEYVPVEQHFVPRMPVSLHPGAMLVSKEGNLIFYQNTNDTSWLPGHYIIGEFTWVID